MVYSHVDGWKSMWHLYSEKKNSNIDIYIRIYADIALKLTKKGIIDMGSIRW